MQFNRSNHSSNANQVANKGIQSKKLSNLDRNPKGKNSFDQIIITAVETSRLLGSPCNNTYTRKYLN